jgi:hypothetical protein
VKRFPSIPELLLLDEHALIPEDVRRAIASTRRPAPPPLYVPSRAQRPPFEASTLGRALGAALALR